ncbi:hypothetical protein Q0F98_15855 [Paenibacillus amylolyticus]|nr:hypothetical protein Q0F98_15855 [Paenibacillus amylolyticus]
MIYLMIGLVQAAVRRMEGSADLPAGVGGYFGHGCQRFFVF